MEVEKGDLNDNSHYNSQQIDKTKLNYNSKLQKSAGNDIKLAQIPKSKSTQFVIEQDGLKAISSNRSSKNDSERFRSNLQN